MVYYFAYGSNMDEERLRQRGVFVKSKFRGFLYGWKLVFNKIADLAEGKAYANISPGDGQLIEGVVYEIDEDALDRLDRYEGCPRHYIKKNLMIKDFAGSAFDCVVYIANENQTYEGLKPSKDYLAFLLNAKDCLSKEYYDFLQNTQTIDK